MDSTQVFILFYHTNSIGTSTLLEADNQIARAGISRPRSRPTKWFWLTTNLAKLALVVASQIRLENGAAKHNGGSSSLVWFNL